MLLCPSPVAIKNNGNMAGHLKKPSIDFFFQMIFLRSIGFVQSIPCELQDAELRLSLRRSVMRAAFIRLRPRLHLTELNHPPKEEGGGVVI